MTTEMYFSVDIETDGDCPGEMPDAKSGSSILSIGVVAMHPETLADVADFYATLKRLPGGRPMNATMEWWDKFPKQWAEARESPIEPKEAMQSLENFVKETLRANKADVPVFVASPAGFDFSYVYYYLHRFLGRSIFGFSALDLKSYCMALSGCPYLQVKRQRKPEWISDLPHTHNALEDARQQADEFRKILAWRREHLLVPKALKKEDQ